MKQSTALLGALCAHGRLWLGVLNMLSQGGLGLLRCNDCLLAEHDKPMDAGCTPCSTPGDGHGFVPCVLQRVWRLQSHAQGAQCAGLFGVNASVLIFPTLLATETCLKGKICLVQNRKFQWPPPSEQFQVQQCSQNKVAAV